MALKINLDERDAGHFLKQSSERPGPSAITYARIASMYERKGLYDKAVSAYRSALRKDGEKEPFDGIVWR